MPYVKPLPRADIAAAYAAGSSVCELVKTHKTTPARIHRILRKFGVPRRTHAEAAQNRYAKRSKADILASLPMHGSDVIEVSDYYEAGHSVRQVRARFGVSSSTLKTLMECLGLGLRGYRLGRLAAAAQLTAEQKFEMTRPARAAMQAIREADRTVRVSLCRARQGKNNLGGFGSAHQPCDHQAASTAR